MQAVGAALRRVATTALVGAVALAACSDDGADRSSSGPSAPNVSAGQVATTELVTGDCITGIVIGLNQRIELESTSVVDCDSRHDLEVFSTFEITNEMVRVDDFAVYPGRGRVISAAEIGCNDALAATGVDTELLGALAFWPSAASWAAGDRMVACAIYLENGRQFDGRQLRLEDAEDG